MKTHGLISSLGNMQSKEAEGEGIWGGVAEAARWCTQRACQEHCVTQFYCSLNAFLRAFSQCW